MQTKIFSDLLSPNTCPTLVVALGSYLPGPQKTIHEVRDPVHVFIHLDSDDRRILDAPPVQRLRYIRQLAMTYLLYPGASHSRFEHSLGVMHVAGLIFDVVTRDQSRWDVVRDLVQENLNDPVSRAYWRKVLILAALCHDIGHLPFSHAAEELLPAGTDHETFTKDLLLGADFKDLWAKALGPTGVDALHVAKLALGEKSAAKAFGGDVTFTPWERVLSEIIVGDTFGSDRIDYLLRDSHHAGVGYGKFDHSRLIETLRLLPQRNGSDVVVLGVEGGGIHSAEALALARHFMFSQVYLHSVRQIYDVHLRDFMLARYQNGVLYKQHQHYTDNEVLADLQVAARDTSAAGHLAAKRIITRKHFKVLYQWNPVDAAINPLATKQVAKAAETEFGSDDVRFAPTQRPASGPIEFPVDVHGVLYDAGALSEVLVQLPPIHAEFVYVAPELLEKAHKWLEKEKAGIIEVVGEQEP